MTMSKQNIWAFDPSILESKRKRAHDDALLFYSKKGGGDSKRQHCVATNKINKPPAQSSTIAPYKTKMCGRWLSGCYMGDRCPFAHRTEDLFRRFYEPEMIGFYQSMIGLEIDASYMARLCKDIVDLSCQNPEGGEVCLFFGNTSMGNKEIQIHMPHHSSRMMPHCTVTCKTCKHAKRVDIYSFTVLLDR